MTTWNENTESGRMMMRLRKQRGKKVPCPYCDGTGHNKENNCECGFCENGVHTLGT